MTTPISGSAPRLNRINSEPLPTSPAKPELTRVDTAPAALPSQPAAATPEAAPAAKAGLGSRIADGFSAAGNSVKGWHDRSVDYRTQMAQGSGVGVMGRPMAAAGVAGGVVGIGSNAKGLHDAIVNGQGGQAIAQNALGLAHSVIGTVKGGLDTAAAFSSAKGFAQLQKDAAKLIGNGQGALSKGVADAVATAVHKGQPLRDVDVLSSIAKDKGGLLNNIKNTTQDFLSEQLRMMPGGGGKLADKLDSSAAKTGTQVADKLGDAAKGGKVVDSALDAAKGAEAALSAGAKGAGTAAKIAGRFAPGLNIAMAGVDTALAARALSDPNASVAKKVTSSITAAGSIAAATNIPIVSQIGAGVSAVSSITGAVIENKDKIKEGFNKLGDKFKSLF